MEMLSTKNVKFVAYLRMKGVHPSKTVKISRGRADYFFEFTKEQWQELKLEFDRSEFLTYAQNLDAIMDLAY